MKKIHTACICIILLLSCFTFHTKTEAATKIFKDVPTNHYAYDAIKWAYDFDIVNGYADGTFRPNKAVTEQQFAQLLVKYFDLEPVVETLPKTTKKGYASDANYNTLAAYSVPLNGYFQNDIRDAAVKRGVVAQAITYVAEGKANLNQSIRFLVDHGISNGQNPKYENTNLQKFFGAPNNLTRAQVVLLFYQLQEKDFFYRSQEAEDSYENAGKIELYKRANNARAALDASLRKGKDWSPTANTKPRKTWDGEYTYFYTYGKGDLDSRGRVLTISNSTKTSFDVAYYTYDGWASGTVEGTATFTSDTKARMSKTVDGDRCVIEFERKNNTTIKTTEFYCETSRDKGTTYTGTLTLE